MFNWTWWLSHSIFEDLGVENIALSPRRVQNRTAAQWSMQQRGKFCEREFYAIEIILVLLIWKRVYAIEIILVLVIWKRVYAIDIILVLVRNDYERVKILFRYGYRLEKKESMTDPLKKIELFKVKTDLVSISNLLHWRRQTNIRWYAEPPHVPGPCQSCLHSGLSGKSERGGDRLLLSHQEVGGATSGNF